MMELLTGDQKILDLPVCLAHIWDRNLRGWRQNYFILESGINEIVFSNQENGNWTLASEVSFANDNFTDNPCFTQDGSRMFFTAVRPIEGINKQSDESIWYVDRLDKGIYEGTPFMAPDESYIIFSRVDFDASGYADLYISFKKPDGSWSTAKNMDLHRILHLLEG